MTEPTADDQPRTDRGTALDLLWAEMLLDACASDGPIRDNDVRQALARYRPRIEAEAVAAERERLLARVPNALMAVWYDTELTEAIPAFLAALLEPAP